MITIYHNPRCSKSREAKAILDKQGVDYKVVEYLKEIPSKVEFKKVLMQLNLKPKDILRKGEAIYKEKFKTAQFTDEEWIEVMLENPKLIERPIVIKQNKAIVARPPENVLELLKSY